MSTRRRDMWKILYKLINRGDTELNECFFTSIYDILCKERSLIQHYSIRKQNNDFQDTIVIWLMNKLISYLGHDHSIEIHDKNVELQHEILTSCLINRTSLFERLVEAYVNAIKELVLEYVNNDPDNNIDTNDKFLKVTSFYIKETAMNEIDSDFHIQPINIRMEQINHFVQKLLSVLSHAHSMGFEIYPELFILSVPNVFLAVKECDFSTKLQCLQYLYKFFENIYELNSKLEHYLLSTLYILEILLEQMYVWLNINCLEINEFDEFVDISIKILNVLLPLKIQYKCRQQLIQILYKMLNNSIEIYPVLTNQRYNIRKLRTMQKSIIDIIVEIQIYNYMTGNYVFDASATHIHLSKMNGYPELVRLIAIDFVGNKSHGKKLEICELFKNICLNVPKNNFVLDSKNYVLYLQILQALIFIEQCQYRESQIEHLKTISNEENKEVDTGQYFQLFQFQLEDLLVQSIHKDEQFTGEFQNIVNDLLAKNAQLNKNEVYVNECYITIFGLILTSNILNFCLTENQMKNMINQIGAPLKNFMNNETNSQLTIKSVQILADIVLNNTKGEFSHSDSISKKKDDMIRQLIKELMLTFLQKLFNQSSNIKDIQMVRQEVCLHINHLLFANVINREELIQSYILPCIPQTHLMGILLKCLLCHLNVRTSRAFLKVSYGYTYNHSEQFEIICTECENNKCYSLQETIKYLEENLMILIKNPRYDPKIILPARVVNKITDLSCKDEHMNFIANHMREINLKPKEWFEELSKFDDNVISISGDVFKNMLSMYMENDVNSIKELAKYILKLVVNSLEMDWPQEQQLRLINVIVDCSSNMNERWFFHFFKMTFFYLLHPNSKIVHETVLSATQMCKNYDIQPIQLWNWYKRDALSLIVKLVIYVYLSKGYRISKSLRAFSKTLGFSCSEEFICKYYRLLTTMILPYCVKEPQCKGLIVNISKINRKDISTLFVVSFLRTYTHIYLTEDANVGNRCIDLIVKCTDYSLNKLMNTDVKQTVSEFLFYFNRDPKFVMKAFDCLLINEHQPSTLIPSTPSNVFSKFIADRFLGVITYFETCLGEPNFEKSLKEESLYSLGQIIRFVGSHHVTQFRFKIIATLCFVLTLDDSQLQGICLKIWNIFLHIVNIQELGPSLGRIAASLLPLLEHHADDVNAIYEFVITRNDSLLGAHISDLYFMENIESVSSCIRQCVARQTEFLRSNKTSVIDKLNFFYKQISNENLQVRIYGLQSLCTFIAENRYEINRMILSEIRLNPLIEDIIEILLAGCRQEDINLNLASSKCLAELGGVDPSYLSSTYTFEQIKALPLSVHTDDFAIMALTELCRAYQFQKDTKYVDSFSLAIQETLSISGISPKDNKKLNIWDAIPERMRQIMEPLLNSCYTGSRRESKCKEHPIFNSAYCRTYEDWAYGWASRLIDFVQADETKHLLNSFKPSIRRDNNTLSILFPYMLLHALHDCNEAQLKQIEEEFKSVFKFSTREITTQNEYEMRSVLKEFQSSKYSADRNNKKTRTEHYDNIENITRKCTKLCSELIDFLQSWQREWQRFNNLSNIDSDNSASYRCINNFIGTVDKVMIAKANYRIGEYARALMYLEQYIECDGENALQEQISFLIEIHGKLLDSDSVEGAVYVKKSNLNLGEEILVNHIVDRPQEMISCYEQLISNSEQINQDDIKGIISCYLRMNTPETALLITDGLWQKLSDQYTDDYFKECKSELLWRLGRYDELEELLEDPVVRRKTTNWNIQCAEAFLIFRDNNIEMEVFQNKLNNIYSNVLSTMRSTNSGVKHNSYTHSYDDIIKLHLLNEIEKVKLLNATLNKDHFNGNHMNWTKTSEYVEKFFVDFDERLSILQPIVRVMEPILTFRRNLLQECKNCLSTLIKSNKSVNLNSKLENLSNIIDTEIGKLWLRSVQMNRTAGSLQQAHLSIMKAEQYAPKSLFIEKSKLLWQKGDQTHSFKLLEENLERIEMKCKNNIKNLNDIDRSLYTEAKFLQATYNAESMNICSEQNIRYFQEAISGNRQSEKCFVHLAQYMEKIYDLYSKEQKDSEIGQRLLLDIMLNYAKSMRFGFEYIYQSLPRLLSFWLDTTAECCVDVDSYTQQPLASKMNELIKNCINVLPTSIFYTALSQLLSRICHPSNDVYNVLRLIVIKLIEKFPHQSLWMLLPIMKSSQTNRVKRCKLIFTDRRLENATFQKLLADFNMLAERFIELTNKDVAFDQKYELSTLVRQLPLLFRDPNFSQILLPFEKYMQASFPIVSSNSVLHPMAAHSNETNSSGSDSDKTNTAVPSNPFPYKQIFITGIKEQITVMRSAAKPKKITILCNDGMEYEVMVKPKDDLRRDFRLMEFNGLVKRYLHQDSQARHRRLRIRTYAAIPFNDECGLVEWLPRLSTFRSICTTIYNSRGLGIPERQLRQYVIPRTEPIDKKRHIFLDNILPKYPPVFQDWFRQSFATPHSWYESRSSYVKTVAVMSMVGYILGLGDRHGENILFDERNGDAVHVDFNCLFNRGESFAFPELVPFRLTHNMVFAMGPLGIEGLYRKCCEITLRVLKHESKTLLSVLRPFVYDFDVLNRPQNRKQTAAELTDPKAMMNVKRIDERLQGYVKKSMPLSIEGQVNFLIMEAINIDNLAAMYIGWGPFL